MKIEMPSMVEREIHDLLGRALPPRPVALISTVGEDGVFNAAPFATLNVMCYKPPILCFSIGLRQGQKKDTLRNIEFSGDFVVNIVGETLIKAAVQTSANYPSGVDEFKEVGLTAITADTVKSPLVGGALVSIECKLVQKLEFGEQQNHRSVIFGEVNVIHVKDELLSNNEIEPTRVKAIGFLAGGIYCRTTDNFPVKTSPL
jgi:flavin reductase (DIM6/NTAB) family NADH-FMN oxidoreductase RutF